MKSGDTNAEILYNRIGAGYNETRRADPYICDRISQLLQAMPDGRYLDLGCGTGNYTTALALKGISICGVDPSKEMLEIAKGRSREVEWKYGVAEQIPYEDDSFAGAVCTLTLHHWQDMTAGFKELERVLQPGGRIVLLTSLPEQMEQYWLVTYFPEMMRVSTDKMPDMNRIEAAANAASLKLALTEKYFVQDDLQDLFLQAGKNRPELYFDEQVRRGISSFANLSYAEEVATGLARLRADIDSGGFVEVRARYDSDAGDYLFVVLEK